MRDPFAGYDSWLEAPYQRMCKEADDYMGWCEEYEMDPDHESSEVAYAEYLDEMYEGEMPDYDDFEEQEEWYNYGPE